MPIIIETTASYYGIYFKQQFVYNLTNQPCLSLYFGPVALIRGFYLKHKVKSWITKLLAIMASYVE